MQEVLRAASRPTIRPVRPEGERARRTMLVVVPDRGAEVVIGRAGTRGRLYGPDLGAAAARRASCSYGFNA